MPKQKTDDLMRLINSLSRAEKRHFRAFVKRNQAQEADILFLQLFNQLEAAGYYDEEAVLKRITGLRKRQLSNIKGHLYKQLLISLRLLHGSRDIEIQLREQIDHARVLYTKGLYQQALDVLDKAKKDALKSEFELVALEIAQFEKLIEAQHISRGIESRAEELTHQCAQLVNNLAATDHYANLAIQMYSHYLKQGLVINKQELHSVEELFADRLLFGDFEQLNFWGQVHHCQAYYWYHHIRQEFPLCYRHTQRLIDLYEANQAMIERKPDLYLRALHNHLSNLFNMWRHDRYAEALPLLLSLPRTYKPKYDFNTEALFQQYRFTHVIMLYFLEGRFTDGLKLVPELTQIIDEDRYHWDEYRNLVFNYRIACLYFGSGDPETAIDYLNRIINKRSPDYRSDIQAYARILSLICHFELGNVQLVEYQVKSVYRFLAKVEHLQETQKVIFRFLRRIPRIREEEIRDEFIQLKKQYDTVSQNPFERRPTLYLDISSWLESNIEGVAVEDVIRKKFLASKSSS
ncbi:MAG: hypothetical protein AAFY36_02965 [Bacteroidota bacterium]